MKIKCYIKPTRKELRKAERDAVRKVRERRTKISIDLPMPIYLRKLISTGKTPQFIGLNIQKKIIYDSMGKLLSGGKNEADAYMYSPSTGRKIRHEIKSSFCPESGMHKLAHIRDYQEFDYFIVCLVDQNKRCKERFYVLPKEYIINNFKLTPMDGTKESNKDNVNVNKALNIYKDIAYEKFGQNNVLGGTSYSHLLRFLDETVSLPKTTRNALVNPIQKVYKNYAFKVNGKLIRGKNNADTIVQLANYIGGVNAMNYFPRTRISQTPTKNCTAKINVGKYYVDPKFEIWEIFYVLDRSKTNQRMKVELV